MGLVSLCLAGRVRGERTGLKVAVRRELTAGLSLYACSSPLTDFPLSWPFGQGFYKLEEASPSFSNLTEPVEFLRSLYIFDGLRRVLGARGLWVPTPTPGAPAPLTLPAPRSLVPCFWSGESSTCSA